MISAARRTIRATQMRYALVQVKYVFLMGLESTRVAVKRGIALGATHTNAHLSTIAVRLVSVTVTLMDARRKPRAKLVWYHKLVSFNAMQLKCALVPAHWASWAVGFHCHPLLVLLLQVKIVAVNPFAKNSHVAHTPLVLLL